ncbi:hypothetical protein PMAA_061530 [Talaromyces marneffei ATCC 18224]|uniref:Carrier domain-containing protein n=1 Tax=Talaromyces marneffei (strain ATCC 18224 / CBS 334.59 / QM 7333) TaxID=441960 RepID=B6QN70_TALMQ|nr:hypothetical protein PMAA_061530 [Talaromyces marneffei ATCC 18224]
MIGACPSEKEWVSDVFVFDPVEGELVEVILGIHYIRVARQGLGKLLSRLTPSSKLPHPSPQPNAAETPKTNGVHEVRHAFDNMTTEPISEPHSNGANEKSKKELPELDIAGKVRDLICTLSGLEPDMIKPEADLANLGIDSLMGMELAREIEIMFKSAFGFQVHPSAADREADNHEKPHVNRFTHPKANGNMNGGSTKVNGTHSHANDPSMPNDMVVPTIAILDAFRETTQLTDQFIEQNNFGNYVQHTLPRLTKLCVIQIIDGFEELGCSLRDAHLGQILNRIKYLPKHEQFVTFFYGVLEKAGPVDLDGSRMTRTATAVPAESAYTLSQNLALDFPEHTYDSQLTYLTGSKLADYLTGKADGLQLIFASAEGRNIVSGMYGKSPINMIDLVFGLLEGWWLFDDGRQHALVPPSIWKTIMQSVGYGYVDWTYSNRPEAAIQRIIIALASSKSRNRVHHPHQLLQRHSTDFTARQAIVDDFVKKYSSGFAAPVVSKALEEGLEGHVDQCILVTSATGSLGSHLVAYFTKLPNVKRMICVNRYSPSLDCRIRQRKALESKGLFLNSVELAKIHVLETDTVKPMMALSNLEYTKLINSVTHIIHNAWPMSITRSIHTFEQQFKAMRNLIELARQISCRYHHFHRNGPRVGFQFISSIATVGCYPLFSGKARVPEDRMLVDSVMPTGYGEAKLIWETMLDETLHKYPQHFRPMIVRIGQIAGSEGSGYWNPVEHLAFLIKSSQTLNILPDLEGDLSWCPVNVVAATLGELLLDEQTWYPVYHIENPVRQPRRKMIHMLADDFHIPNTGIIPFKEWLERVRRSPSSPDDNPASNLAGFLDMYFVRMSCGGLILDTARSRENSWTLRDTGPVSRSLVMKFIQVWKERGFLKQSVAS